MPALGSGSMGSGTLGASATAPRTAPQALAELFYEDQGWFRELDEEGSGDLWEYSRALMAPSEELYDVVRPRPGRAGWDLAYDPDGTPASWLVWLGQHVGVVLTPEMDEAQRRDEIREPTGWRRGQDAAVQIATRRTLVPVVEGEELFVILRPNTPEPGRTFARTLTAQTPEPARTERVLREKLPWWTRLDYAAISALSYADLEGSKYQTYGELEASPISTYGDLEEALPGDL